MSHYPSYQEQCALLSAEQQDILEKIPHLEKIDGWLLLSEAVELFSLSNQIVSPNPVVCEIGTWKGKSAYIFSTAIRGKNGTLYCIDPFIHITL
ncbi:MAG: hypothetical protein AAB547_01925 [Patescibacteria group bacterium]